jgi:hypothetical protein
VLDGAGDHTLELQSLEGLEEIVEGSAAEGAGGDVNVVYGGEHDHREAGVVGGEAVEQSETVSAGHHDVGEDKRVSGILREHLDGFLCSGRSHRRKAAVLEQGRYDASDRRFIVDYKDSLLHLL